ncbi:MAG: hypothetical protein AB8B61_03635 [Cyclobacteriaceae bacterium]
MKGCSYCSKPLEGRVDKKFCNSYCKTAFHYEKRKAEQPSFFEQVDRQLKTNRRILKEYNKAGKSTVRKALLLEEGFDPNYFTHYWKNNKGQVYLFCYEYGFLSLKENQKDKFVLVKWQHYMNG